MREPVWLDRAILEAIHFDQIQEHGGRLGVRDEGLIESALARPRNKWAYEEACDLASLAAAYGYGLARNHPFVDGNKRVAFMAMYVFLGLNGWDLDAPEPEVVTVVNDVASRRLGEEELAAWLRARWVRRRDRTCAWACWSTYFD